MPTIGFRLPGWRTSGTSYGASIAAPSILVAAHLVGGASGPVLSAAATIAMALVAVSTLTGAGRGFSSAYLRGLLFPAAASMTLILLAFISVHPASLGLRQGLADVRLSLSTLSVDPAATWVEIMKLMGLAAAFLAARPAGADPSRMQTAIRTMVLLGALWALWALLLFIAQSGHDAQPRLGRPFVSPNVAAACISVTLLCGVFAVRERIGLLGGRSRSVILGSLIGSLLVTCLVLTGSRSAITIMAAIGGGALVARWILGVRRSPTGGAGFLPIVVLIGVSVLAIVIGVDLFDRFTRLGADAIDRWTILTTYAEAAEKSPWFGYGLGTTPRLSRLLLVAENEAAFWNIRAVHNLPVQWWLETGLVGLVFASLALVTILTSTIKGLSRRTLGRVWPLLMVSVLFILQGMVDYTAQIYSMALTWAYLLGLVYSAATVDAWRQRRSSRRPIDSARRPPLRAADHRR